MPIVGLGDAITFVVVLAVILVFRQLDRNNRSLEKVKRYGDRVMQTLSTFVEKKSAEIKDLAIEVQISVKQGKELLRSVREVQEDLAARSRDLEERSGEIEAIRSRIDGYDTALAELVNMSERVDDNLRRLRGEDERLRRVDEQRTALQERIAGLDSTAAAVEGRLRRVEDTAEKALSDKLTELDEQVTRLRPGVLELAAGLAELEGRVDALAINKENADAVIRSLEGIDGLLSELESRTERLMTARNWLARAETRLEQIGQRARASVRDLEAAAAAPPAEDHDVGAGSRPGVTSRETVSKLAGQGWSIPEIARATKLSRGEVELILAGEPATGALPNA
jgi:chromosome segregation ATPase